MRLFETGNIVISQSLCVVGMHMPLEKSSQPHIYVHLCHSRPRSGI